MSGLNAVRDARSRRELCASLRIPYTSQATASLVRTKAGDFVQVFRLQGGSFQSADDETLNQWHERLNLTWRNLASPQVAMWVHVVRRRERLEGAGTGGDTFAERLAHRYRQRLAGETLMVNELYLSIVYRPAVGVTAGLAARLMQRRNDVGMANATTEAIETSEKLAGAVLSSLDRYEPERLTAYCNGGRWYSPVLELLGGLINGEMQPMPMPRAPLDEVLATSRLVFGTEVIEYRLPTKTRLGAMLGIKEYPTPSVVGMFNPLLSAPFEFVLTQSFTCLTKATAQGLLQRQYNRMANAGDFSVSQAEELTEALDELTSNGFVMGDHHFSLQVMTEADTGRDGRSAEERMARLNDAVALARALLSDSGMTVAREDLGLEAAFWAQLPGCFALRPRKSPITSRNFSAMAPFHNFPAGRAQGNHWGEALAVLMTQARSPYHFSLHASDPRDPDGGSRKDTGHTFICGPTGSGKTVFIGFLVSLLATRGVSQVVFDKDQGLEILVRALGGEYFSLQNGAPTGLNPLQLEANATNVEFMKAWLGMLARGSRVLKASEHTELEQALRGTLALPVASRRLSRLIEFTDATVVDGVHANLSRWCESCGGEYAWVFDNPVDTVVPRMGAGTLVGFDVTHFLNHETIRGPLNRYLFHLVERLLDGRPLVCWVDEFSTALADRDFQGFADNAPKTWRKLNGVLCAATQTAGSVLDSPIARTIVEQTATKIFFPNPDANAKDYVEGFGLTQREFHLIHEQLEPGSRSFLVKQGHASVVCQLDLRGFDAELRVISGRRRSVEQMRVALERAGGDPQCWLPVFLSMGSQ
ncbi:MAG TPA: VirB4 family type IV secretion/conjugal transfer ATPase [Povalibacter sp.]|uniref:VirB4 family type IV secretion/conjugal transfer ATPase n=1 Tax=Povalibacter sp. TaxID=1962978 RepID=UPI002B94E9B8|nr:VirB4 family type IV secretion/conjugal transfer ATPase [Povalibacter sp.]HMN43827.1 VirB4 family type IV secretion/conjugal transfer ATPase [Povalibacter sp.]